MKSQFHGTNWGTLRRAVAPPLLTELCRRFHSKQPAILCAMRHGQLTIDGYVIREIHLARWTPEQLCGRYARLCGQQVQLYGSKVVEP